MGGGIGKIEMLKKTNILSLVGGGRNPRFPPNKIIIWDDHQGKIISQLRFNKQIIGLRLRGEKLIGISEDKIYIFNINTLETETSLDTFENINGIIGISNGDNNILMIAYPYLTQGTVNIKNCINQKMAKTSKIISAHESKIACLCINKEGNLLATASDKGTLIRIFITSNGSLISELRRGTKNVYMTCITFDPNNRFIGCASNVGTIHVFSIIGAMKLLAENINNTNNNSNNNNVNSSPGNNNNLQSDTIINAINEEDEPKNSKSFFGKITGILKIKNAYLDSERSFAKFRIPEHNNLLGFGNDNTFVVITLEGKYYKAAYDPKNGGDCCKIDEKDIIHDEK